MSRCGSSRSSGCARPTTRGRGRHPAADEGRPARQTRLWSGFAYVATLPDQDADLDAELAQIEQFLDRHAEPGAGWRDRVGAARWGPGRFRTAFTTAVEEGRIERGGGWRTADQAASAR